MKPGTQDELQAMFSWVLGFRGSMFPEIPKPIRSRPRPD
jgi:hypothetical protein